LLIESEKKTNELNKLREIIHNGIHNIKDLISDYSNHSKSNKVSLDDKEVKIFIESKPIEDKFKFYLEKLFGFINYR